MTADIALPPTAVRRRPVLLAAALLAPVLACAGLLALLLSLPGQEAPIAAFSTGLRGRNDAQVHNVRLALAALDGVVIPPGKVFSFTHTVGPWGPDKGYRRAPVSFSGECVLDWGGGVCQASSTLYNTALLAGLPILERHHHHWAAPYVPPGQDAAVAFPSVDLRFRNSLGAPLRISARVAGDAARIELYCRRRPPRVHLERQLISMTPPTTVVSSRPHRRAIRGFPGYDVAIYRVTDGKPDQPEFISRDSYPAQNAVVGP